MADGLSDAGPGHRRRRVRRREPRRRARRAPPRLGRRRARQPPPARLGAQPAAPARARASSSCTATCASPATSRRSASSTRSSSARPSRRCWPGSTAGRLRRADEPDRRLQLPRARAPAAARSSSSSRPAASTRSPRSTRCAYDETRDALRAGRRAGARRRLAAGSPRTSRSRARARSTARRSSPPSCWSPSTRESFGLRAVDQPLRRDRRARGRWARSTRASSPTGCSPTTSAGRSRYIGYGGTRQAGARPAARRRPRRPDRRAAAPTRTTGRGATVNVGGGRACSLSLLETTELCRELTGTTRRRRRAPARTGPGDVPIYLSDCRAAVRADRLAAAPRPARRSSRTSHAWIARATSARVESAPGLRPEHLQGRRMRRLAIVTGSGGLIGSESVAHFVRAGYDVVGIENDMRARFFGPERLDGAHDRSGCSTQFRRQLPLARARHPRRRRRRPRSSREHARASSSSSSTRRRSRRTTGRRPTRRPTSPSTPTAR